MVVYPGRVRSSKWSLVLALHMAGCSVAVTARPSPGPPVERPRCERLASATRSDFIGAAVAAGAGLTMLVAGAATAEESDNPAPLPDGKQMNGLMMGGALALALVVPAFGASGGYGLMQTRRCREAQDAFDRGGSGGRDAARSASTSAASRCSTSTGAAPPSRCASASSK